VKPLNRIRNVTTKAVKGWAAAHLDEFDSKGLTNLVWGAANVDDVCDDVLCMVRPRDPASLPCVSGLFFAPEGASTDMYRPD
jgi:hypothetical protein